jgi:thiamine biosynthesis protein ThiS
VTIILNGESFAVDRDPASFTVAALLSHLDVDPARVAVERNFVVVKRHAYASTPIADGDQIEIVNFVGGG